MQSVGGKVSLCQISALGGRAEWLPKPDLRTRTHCKKRSPLGFMVPGGIQMHCLEQIQRKSGLCAFGVLQSKMWEGFWSMTQKHNGDILNKSKAFTPLWAMAVMQAVEQ